MVHRQGGFFFIDGVRRLSVRKTISTMILLRHGFHYEASTGNTIPSIHLTANSHLLLPPRLGTLPRLLIQADIPTIPPPLPEPPHAQRERRQWHGHNPVDPEAGSRAAGPRVGAPVEEGHGEERGDEGPGEDDHGEEGDGFHAVGC